MFKPRQGQYIASKSQDGNKVSFEEATLYDK